MIQQRRARWAQAGLVSALLALAALFPLESDDCYFFYWQFASLKDLLLTRPITWAAPIVGVPQNGRFLGNLLGVLLAKCYESPLFPLRILFFAGGFFALAWAGSRCLSPHDRRGEGFWFLLALLVLAPRVLWQEVYSWGAAYVNYVTPVVLLLLLVPLVRRAGEKAALPRLAAVALTALAACLFLETNTLFLCMASTLALGWQRFQARKITPAWAVLWLAALGGTALMFLSPGYHAVGEDGLRELGLSMLGVNLAKILVGTLVRPTVAALMITALLLWHLRRQGGGAWLWCMLPAIPIHLFCLWDGLCDLFDPGDTVTLEAPTPLQTGAAAALALLWLGMLCLWRGGRAKWTAALLAGCLVLVSAPLLVISLNGNRNFFSGYAVLTLTALVLYQRARELGLGERSWLRWAALAAACALVFLYACNALVYRQRLQDARAQAAAGAEQVTLPLVPFAGFARNEQPWKGDISYQVYRETPWDVSFVFVPYAQWREAHTP